MPISVLAHGFSSSQVKFCFCELIFAKSFQAAPQEVVCKSGQSKKVGFQKVVLSSVHFEKPHVFCRYENRLSVANSSPHL